MARGSWLPQSSGDENHLAATAWGAKCLWQTKEAYHEARFCCNLPRLKKKENYLHEWQCDSFHGKGLFNRFTEGGATVRTARLFCHQQPGGIGCFFGY